MSVTNLYKKGNISMQRTALYRHFNADGELLYVGISISALTRLIQHKAVKDWATEIAQMTVEYFDNREAALEAERIAIQSERPLWNVKHNRHDDSKPEPSWGLDGWWAIVEADCEKFCDAETGYTYYREKESSVSELDPVISERIDACLAQMAEKRERDRERNRKYKSRSRVEA